MSQNPAEFSPVSGREPGAQKHIYEEYDPIVEGLLKAETDDLVGNILSNIGPLTLKQRVHVLLKLSDAEFEEFTRRRSEGFSSLSEDVISGKLPTQTPEERIRALSQLRSTRPRYEVEAELRRRWNLNYPIEWDADLQEDPKFRPDDGLLRLKDGKLLTYEEAVAFTRFENTRRWYRNWLFPLVTRRADPLPLTLTTVNQAFQGEKDRLRDEKHPGAAIELSDLISVTNYYELEHEPDNPENCAVHRQVRAIAQFINEINSPTD